LTTESIESSLLRRDTSKGKKNIRKNKDRRNYFGAPKGATAISLDYSREAVMVGFDVE